MEHRCYHTISNDITSSPRELVSVSKYDTTHTKSIIFKIWHIQVLKPSGFRPGIKTYIVYNITKVRKYIATGILFNGYHTHHLRQLLLNDLHWLLTYNTENLWVDKLSKGKLVYPKGYASQVHKLQQAYKEGRWVSRPIPTNILYTGNTIKLSYYPRVFLGLSVLTFP